MKDKIDIIEVKTDEHFQKAFEIRKKVFVEEQNVPAENEIDAIDSEAIHILAFHGDEAAGVARIFSRKENPSEAWIGRVAVLKKFRKMGLGKLILKRCLVIIESKKCFNAIRLHSQKYIAPLYIQFGFVPIGEPFFEEGIEHLDMIKRVS
ncbi:MAG: GNAT family N-acetyltransferase [Candidatus Riflebacteria bacterium]|nr:GNAT family N-acetyltransferase [Candidatus Riflebacteria bacterium]